MLELWVEVGECGMTPGGHAVDLDCRSDTADAQTEGESAAPGQGASLTIEHNVELRPKNSFL